jgi:hypothetical protein
MDHHQPSCSPYQDPRQQSRHAAFDAAADIGSGSDELDPLPAGGWGGTTAGVSVPHHQQPQRPHHRTMAPNPQDFSGLDDQMQQGFGGPTMSEEAEEEGGFDPESLLDAFLSSRGGGKPRTAGRGTGTSRAAAQHHPHQGQKRPSANTSGWPEAAAARGAAAPTRGSKRPAPAASQSAAEAGWGGEWGRGEHQAQLFEAPSQQPGWHPTASHPLSMGPPANKRRRAAAPPPQVGWDCGPYGSWGGAEMGEEDEEGEGLGGYAFDRPPALLPGPPASALRSGGGCRGGAAWVADDDDEEEDVRAGGFGRGGGWGAEEQRPANALGRAAPLFLGEEGDDDPDDHRLFGGAGGGGRMAAAPPGFAAGRRGAGAAPAAGGAQIQGGWGTGAGGSSRKAAAGGGWGSSGPRLPSAPTPVAGGANPGNPLTTPAFLPHRNPTKQLGYELAPDFGGGTVFGDGGKGGWGGGARQTRLAWK